MRLFALVLVGLALVPPAFGADVRVTTVAPVEDVSLPFFCDWGYDWDERCYRDDSQRLSVGGEPGKVWRSALRFPLGAVPAGASVVTAELSLWYDGTCVAGRKRLRPCDGRAFDLEAHRILTARWFSEREVEADPLPFTTAIERGARPGWVTFDVTDLVTDWVAGAAPDNGVLVQLAGDEEALDVAGPAFPSSESPAPAWRPRLTVWWRSLETRTRPAVPAAAAGEPNIGSGASPSTWSPRSRSSVLESTSPRLPRIRTTRRSGTRTSNRSSGRHRSRSRSARGSPSSRTSSGAGSSTPMTCASSFWTSGS